MPGPGGLYYYSLIFILRYYSDVVASYIITIIYNILTLCLFLSATHLPVQYRLTLIHIAANIQPHTLPNLISAPGLLSYSPSPVLKQTLQERPKNSHYRQQVAAVMWVKPENAVSGVKSGIL